MAESTLRLRTDADCDDLFERRLVAEIQSRGFAVAHESGWCYTVGLWAGSGLPELIVFGLPAQRGQALLQLAAGAGPLGEVVGSLTEQHALQVHPVRREAYRQYLPYARWYYRGEAFPAQQLVWPDPEGRYPDEVDFQPRLRALQPLLNG